jgi:hypothetical protein
MAETLLGWPALQRDTLVDMCAPEIGDEASVRTSLALVVYDRYADGEQLFASCAIEDEPAPQPRHRRGRLGWLAAALAAVVLALAGLALWSPAARPVREGALAAIPPPIARSSVLAPQTALREDRIAPRPAAAAPRPRTALPALAAIAPAPRPRRGARALQVRVDRAGVVEIWLRD